jgi:hypothetical protein
MEPRRTFRTSDSLSVTCDRFCKADANDVYKDVHALSERLT